MSHINNQSISVTSTKVCSHCQVPKPLSEFSKCKDSKDGLGYWCKGCIKQYNFEHKEEHCSWWKQYYPEHKEEIKLYQKQWNLENPEYGKQYSQQHYLNNKEKIDIIHKQHYIENKDHVLLQQKQRHIEHKEEDNFKSRQHYSDHKDEIRIQKNQYFNNKLKTDPQFRILCLLRSRTKHAIKSQGVKKSLHTVGLLGCTPDFFQNYIKSHLKPGMTLENNGLRKWHLHHIKYCHTFDLRDLEQQKLCFHYTNMIPMWQDEHNKLHENDAIQSPETTAS